MSLARRCNAVKMVVSTRRMIGLMSPCWVSLSIEILSSPPSSSWTTFSAKPSLASSSTRFDCSVFLRISVICARVATLVTIRLPSSKLISSIIINWLGSAIAIASRPSRVSSTVLPIPACLRALMNARSQREYRQIKRNQDSADKYRHNDEDKRFDHDHGRGQRCLHVLLIEFGHRIQHRRQRAGRFAYFDHFYGQIGENLLLFQTTRQRLSLPHAHRGTLYPLQDLAAAH